MLLRVHGFLVQNIGNDNEPDALNALVALIREVARVVGLRQQLGLKPTASSALTVSTVFTARSLFPLFGTRRGGHPTKHEWTSVIERSVTH